jgi:hypothetical protein
MKTLTFEQMEETCAGSKYWYLEAGCIAGAIGMGLLSGPAFALTASFTLHVCGAHILSLIRIK